MWFCKKKKRKEREKERRKGKEREKEKVNEKTSTKNYCSNHLLTSIIPLPHNFRHKPRDAATCLGLWLRSYCSTSSEIPDRISP